MTGIAARLAAHLADLPGGVGCRHLARRCDDLDAGILVDLGFVKPIVTRVPDCAEHGCPLREQCPHVADFASEAGGRKSGVKYRPTAEGLAAAGDPSLVLRAVRDLPAAGAVLAGLVGGPTTVFALHATFVERARDAADRGERIDLPGLNRVTLGATLDLLTEIGLIARAEDGVTYADGGG